MNMDMQFMMHLLPATDLVETYAGLVKALAITWQSAIEDSYRLFQADKIFPWDGNGESWSGRTLEPDYNYYEHWWLENFNWVDNYSEYIQGTLWLRR